MSQNVSNDNGGFSLKGFAAKLHNEASIIATCPFWNEDGRPANIASLLTMGKKQEDDLSAIGTLIDEYDGDARSDFGDQPVGD